MEAVRQVSGLGGVEGSWERGDQVTMENVAGWIKVQTRSSDGIQPYSGGFEVEEERDFSTEVCLPHSFISTLLESSIFFTAPEPSSSPCFAAFCLLVLLAF